MIFVLFEVLTTANFHKAKKNIVWSNYFLLNKRRKISTEQTEAFIRRENLTLALVSSQRKREKDSDDSVCNILLNLEFIKLIK